MSVKTRKSTKLFFLVFLFPCCAETFAQNETAKEVIAIQIRKQGFPCDNPISAERDTGDSRADSPVWILKCENQNYKVRLNPGMAAAVEKVN